MDDLLFIVAASLIGAVAVVPLAFTFFLFLLETVGRLT